MFAFVFGVVFGILTAVALARGRVRLGRMRSTVERLLLTDQSAAPALPQDIVSGLKHDAPDLLRVIQQAPAVKVEDQPAELPQAAVEEIRQAKSLNAARAITRRWITNEDVADAMTAAIHWKPKHYHLTEKKYQTSLKDHLLDGGWYRDGHVVEHLRLDWYAEAQDQSRVALPDFALGDPQGPKKRKVLLELKADLDTSEKADRALGQMLRYLFAWKKCGPAILVVGGESPSEIRALVRLQIANWREQMRLPVTVYFKRYDTAIEARRAAVMPAGGEEEE